MHYIPFVVTYAIANCRTYLRGFLIIDINSKMVSRSIDIPIGYCHFALLNKMKKDSKDVLAEQKIVNRNY